MTGRGSCCATVGICENGFIPLYARWSDVARRVCTFVLPMLCSIMALVRRLSSIVVLLSLLLTACGSGSSGGSACQNYWFEQVGACLPDAWQLLDRAELLQRGIPEDVIIAFQNETSVSGQYPTVSITREPLATVVEPVAYSEATIRSVAVLPGYKLIDQKKVTIDGISLPVHVFFAQPVTGEPQRRFLQVSTVVGQNGYTVTALTPLTVSSDLESEIFTILGSITFKAPVEDTQS
ncbi:hypothetical protein AUJ46_03825 [Candidatus Peregrinibacteria bacterium CG1_02_54_53]|nr:MAG: hypothetical protein AUJ46_03825 [Candidatus Peregrinibacteria bacterium CG1_02_54_53]